MKIECTPQELRELIKIVPVDKVTDTKEINSVNVLNNYNVTELKNDIKENLLKNQ